MKKKSLVVSLSREVTFIVFLLILISLIGITCRGQPLADTYAPIFYFEGAVTCYPIDASYQIDNSQLNYIVLNSEETYYYDNIYGTIKDNGVINHYQSVMSSYDFTVYYRTINDTATGSTIIQYWMFYAFNKGELNQHEGDWEMVQVVLDDNDVPSWVAYSQHYSGQKATWSQVEKDNNHIKVYVARGSHANYLRSYSGKFGIASDSVGANGKILKPSEYTLDTLEDKTWIDFEGRWGEVADTEANAIQASILGQAGPEGPKFRENGEMWNDPVGWGEGLFESNDMLFTFEWFLYNFVTIFIIISLIIIALMAFRIYRGHKKYGLGPRIVSMLYINGFNLHSIGNILCFLGIIMAIIGLFNPWYIISYQVSGGITETFQTRGLVDLLKFDGINGLQVTIPGTSGPIPLGSFVLPFSLFIAIGLIFLIIATIGIPLSKKLGSKYIWRGVRLVIPFILIVIVIMAIGSVIPTTPIEAGTETNYAQDILNSISGSPFGGQTSTYISENGITGQIDVQWGLGLGGWLLLIAGIIIIIAGIFELLAKTQFFTTKIPLKGQIPPGMQIPPAQAAPLSSKEPQYPPKQKAPPKDKYKARFCTECGEKLEDNATFCMKCGKKTGK